MIVSTVIGIILRVLPFLLGLPAVYYYENRLLIPAAILTALCALGTALSGRREDPADFRAYIPVLAISVLIAGVALRFWQLAEIPLGFSGHCAGQFELRAAYLENLGSIFTDPLAWSRIRWESLLIEETAPVGLLEAIGFSIYGVSLTSTRYLPAILGSITVLLAFTLAARIRGATAGVLFSALIASAPWNLQFSRYSNTEHVMAPLHFLLSLYFLHRAASTEKLRDFLWFGLICGLSFYLYAAVQIVPLIAAIFLVALILLQKNFLRGNWWKMLLLIIIACVVAGPQLEYWYRNEHLIPIRKSSYDNNLYHFSSWGEIWLNFASIPQQLFVQVADPWIDRPGGALAGSEAVFALAGLPVMARMFFTSRWRSALLLAISLLVSSLPGVLSPEVPYRRLVLFGVMLDLLSALGLSQLFAMAVTGCRQQLRIGVLFIITAAICLFQGKLYFDQYGSFETWSNRVIWRMARQGEINLGSKFVYMIVPDRSSREMAERLMKIAAFDLIRSPRDKAQEFQKIYEVVEYSELPSLTRLNGLKNGTLVIVQEGSQQEPGPDLDLAPAFKGRMEVSGPEYVGNRIEIQRIGESQD